jgi:hypothetical protein
MKYRVYVRYENEFIVEADNVDEAIEQASFMANDMPPSQFIKESGEEIEAIQIEDME